MEEEYDPYEQYYLEQQQNPSTLYNESTQHFESDLYYRSLPKVPLPPMKPISNNRNAERRKLDGSEETNNNGKRPRN